MTDVTFVEIEAFIPIRAAQFIGQNSRYDFSLIGIRQFLVSAVEPTCRTIFWDGESYEDAILAAEELAASFRCDVHDRVLDGAG